MSCKNMAKTNILKSIYITYVSLISLISFSKCDLLTDQASTIAGLTMYLIHRDSIQSPFYDPSLSSTQRLVNSIQRSFNYIQRFNKSHIAQFPEADIVRSNVQYLLKYSIGTPPVPIIGVLDTGSSFLWTQCEPCIQCYPQNMPIFTPIRSSTYTTIPCTSMHCGIFNPFTNCDSKTDTCIFDDRYADGSYGEGTLSKDTLTLASTGGTKTSIPNFIFGCGHRNKKVLHAKSESGIVGLGDAEVSLLRQLGPLAQGKFSYCLVPRDETSKSLSKLSFGTNADVSGMGAVSTPLIQQYHDVSYYVTLFGISVGNQMIKLENSEEKFIEEGNMVVDSGAQLMMLPRDMYNELKREMLSQIKLPQNKYPPIKYLDLCFDKRPWADVQFPNVTLHFDGADVNLRPRNMFIKVTRMSICLACIPANDGYNYLGNVAQEGFLVGFDLEKREVRFKPSDCD